MPPSHLRWPIVLSVVAAILTIGMKSTAYALTGSVGLLSDALESVVNLLAAVTAYLSLAYAARPADPTHTYGHEKIEYFSSGLEGVLILLAGFGTAGYAVRRLIDPEPLADLEVGAAIALAASAVNFAVARVLLVQGRKHRSIVLEADGKHLMSDVVTSVGVVAGLGLVLLTKREWLDTVLAIAVGLNIVWTGYELIRRSFNGLMDHALPPADQERIRNVIQGHLPPGATFHALRTNRSRQRLARDRRYRLPRSTGPTCSVPRGEFRGSFLTSRRRGGFSQLFQHLRFPRLSLIYRFDVDHHFEAG